MNADRHLAPGARKTTQLRQLLASRELEFILEAHNGISARIVEEAGFKGIWASGLALSAQFGVRDNNEASWTQVVDMVEFMSDVTRIPILLDGDTGYGNFNNMRRLVRKLEQRGVAGVCIEDKLFPKTNSFIDGERQELADIDEFCGKIAAGKDSQSDDDFCVVARIEAYIAGWDTREALRRASAYHAAGADAILVHSAWSTPDQILEFAREWANRAPLVIVPTKYYSTPTPVFREAGISLVIWANHLIRSAVDAMQETARQIHADQTLVTVEDQIASVKEIFRLQGADELAEAERRYVYEARRDTRAVILAASRGEGLDDLTRERPKVMLPVNGKPLLKRLVERCRKQQVDSVTVVAGYKAEHIDVGGIDIVHNPRYADSGELASLACARPIFRDDMVVMYGDLIFRSYVLRGLMESDRDLTVVVDSQYSVASSGGSGKPDYAYCSVPDDRSLWGQDVLLERISSLAESCDGPAHGRWIGMLRTRARGREWLENALDALAEREDFDSLDMGDLLNHIVARGHAVRVIYIHGHWLDVNSLRDLEQAGRFTAGQR
ncbi:MAG: phosphoenolpyruvate mutase [Proteobacteria bacterium]|nr:phosphoenolpyruvate mutase [Pseudomonadota bacterium]